MPMEPIAILRGRVIHGKGLGRTVGMPTANLDVSRSSEIPPEGVYASIARVRSGSYYAVTNIGTRPSVDSSPKLTIETNIIDFDEGIYGEDMIVEIMAYLRPIKRMEGIEEVKKQVDADKLEARKILSVEPLFV